MRSHLKATVAESSADYSLLFREMYCTTAQSLADSLSLSIENLGVSYDQILETGIQSSQRTRIIHASGTTANGHQFGRGQFVFLVKHASRTEAAQLSSSGYRFADPSNVVGTVSRAMQVDRADVERHVARMHDYYGPQSAFKPGVHIGFFGMRPNIQRGFNVVVKENQTHEIPSTPLPVKCLDAAQDEFVMQYIGKNVDTIIKELRAPEDFSPDFDMQTFRYFLQMVC